MGGLSMLRMVWIALIAALMGRCNGMVVHFLAYYFIVTFFVFKKSNNYP